MLAAFGLAQEYLLYAVLGQVVLAGALAHIYPTGLGGQAFVVICNQGVVQNHVCLGQPVHGPHGQQIARPGACTNQSYPTLSRACERRRAFGGVSVQLVVIDVVIFVVGLYVVGLYNVNDIEHLNIVVSASINNVTICVAVQGAKHVRVQALDQGVDQVSV